MIVPRRASASIGLALTAFLGLAFTLVAHAAHAGPWPTEADSARPCRPTVSCTADITTPGTLEIEAGGLASKNGGSHTWTTPLLIKQTVAPWLQLQVGSNGLTLVSGSTAVRYLDNVIVGSKLHLLDQGAVKPSLAVTVQGSFPTFAADGYARHESALFTGHASKDIGPLHVDWNLGVDALQLDSAPKAQVFSALALSGAVSGPFGAALETYLFSGAATAATKDGGVRAAWLTTARPWLVFDVGGDVGFFSTIRSYSLFFGATVIPAVFMAR